VINEQDSRLISRADRIAGKLSRLSGADQSFSVFGSISHQYRLAPTLPIRAVQEYEEQRGVQLPAEYRLFVTRIGRGGAGPYYGLFSLNGRDPEDITDFDRIRRPFLWTQAFNPYNWEDACSRKGVWCDDDCEEGERPQVILSVPGALYICHYGCAIRFFLIVNGTCFGEVWRDSQADDRGIMPECDSNGRHLCFFDWYENWLDSGIAARADLLSP
jgi:hypothetical protein